MPFLITTVESREAYERRRASDPGAYRSQGVSRRAVTTLDEAREGARLAVERSLRRKPQSELYASARNLPESGGSVGPLPDGTLIEVEQVTWADLRERTPGLDRNSLAFDHRTLAAFNAAQAGA